MTRSKNELPDHVIQTTLQMPRDEHRALRILALDRRVPMAEIIRQLVHQELMRAGVLPAAQ